MGAEGDGGWCRLVRRSVFHINDSIELDKLAHDDDEVVEKPADTDENKQQPNQIGRSHVVQSSQSQSLFESQVMWLQVGIASTTTLRWNGSFRVRFLVTPGGVQFGRTIDVEDIGSGLRVRLRNGRGRCSDGGRIFQLEDRGRWRHLRCRSQTP